jgi:NADH-quinone oxidoreductase subunit I
MSLKNLDEQESCRTGHEKGVPILTLDNDGELQCNGCMLCAYVCPAKCIKIEHRNNEIGRCSWPIQDFYIDMKRCIFCGQCEEACPIDAIRLSPNTSFAGFGNSNFLWNKELLAFREPTVCTLVDRNLRRNETTEAER